MAGTRGSLLIAAVSGRALAQAAVDAGYMPLVADFFADADTQAIAGACARLPGSLEDGIRWRPLKAALESLESGAPSPVLGVVYGSGFEAQPELLDRISERWPLLGNDANTVARLKQPQAFFALLDRSAIPHPTTTTQEPGEPAGWIVKRQGGAGGSHIQPAKKEEHGAELYYQRFVPGRSISALFVADGQTSCVLGFSEQWAAPAPGKPWRYGGAVQPASILKSTAVAMTDIVAVLTRRCGLRGLASADFVLSDTEPYLLEVNPRPGATLDVFANSSNPPLALHLNAVLAGKLPEERPTFLDGCASAILYAQEPLIAPIDITWPTWVADIPPPGQQIDKQRPICTVLARATSGARAREMVEARLVELLARIREATSGSRPRDESTKLQGTK